MTAIFHSARFMPLHLIIKFRCVRLKSASVEVEKKITENLFKCSSP